MPVPPSNLPPQGPPQPPAPTKINLPPEDEAIEPSHRPVVTALPMTELEREGVGLANMVLWIIAGLAVCFLALIAKSEFHDVPADVGAVQKILETIASNTTPPSAETMDKVLQAQQKIADSRQSSRAFWKEIIQAMLVSIFLPVLTAVLGYIFGTSRSTNKGNGSG